MSIQGKLSLTEHVDKGVGSRGRRNFLTCKLYLACKAINYAHLTVAFILLYSRHDHDAEYTNVLVNTSAGADTITLDISIRKLLS